MLPGLVWVYLPTRRAHKLMGIVSPETRLIKDGNWIIDFILRLVIVLWVWNISWLFYYVGRTGCEDVISMYTPFVVNSMHTLAHQNYKTSSERGYNVSILCYPDIETLQVISKAKQSTTSISLNCYICLFTASLTSLNHSIAILYFVGFDDI